MTFDRAVCLTGLAVILLRLLHDELAQNWKRNVVICMLHSPWLTSTCSTITCFWRKNKQRWHNIQPQWFKIIWHIYMLMTACSALGFLWLLLECLGGRHNTCALIGNGHLELLALFLTVFACSLHLRLHLCNLSLQQPNLHSDGLDGQFQVLNFGLTARLLALLLWCKSLC